MKWRQRGGKGRDSQQRQRAIERSGYIHVMEPMELWTQLKEEAASIPRRSARTKHPKADESEEGVDIDKARITYEGYLRSIRNLVEERACGKA